jgi:hypothetical protein
LPVKESGAAQVTHGELKITENFKKIFPNNKRVIYQWPILFKSHIVFNTRFSRLQNKLVLQHIQVNVLINRAIKTVRSVQSILQLVENYVTFTPNKAVSNRNRTQRSLIEILEYGTFVTKNIPFFGLC